MSQDMDNAAGDAFYRMEIFISLYLSMWFVEFFAANVVLTCLFLQDHSPVSQAFCRMNP